MPPLRQPRGHILVVDDDPYSLRLLGTLLGDAGYRVDTAADGEQGLLAVERHRPDLVILDVRMPGMDGFDVCRSLRRDPACATMPVIFLSAAADPDDRIQGFEAGGVDFIAKPLNADDVLARVRTHIESALAARELVRRHASRDASPPQAQPRSAAGPKDEAPPEILVVEDTPESRHLIATILSQAGFSVREAPNGELALWTAARRPPNLVLLDIRMPGLNGYDVCRCLKADPATAGVPVIFLSAMSDREDKAEGFASGAVDYIVKPFTESDVLARVNAHLRPAAYERPVEGSADETGQPKPCCPAVDLEAGIRHALASGQLELLYQPLIDLASNRLLGAEALLRWHVPGIGTLEPAQFMDLAEATGDIVPIGDWVIGSVCAQLRQWRTDLAADFRIAINLSPLQFWQDGLARCIERSLKGAGVPASWLELDIGESTLYEDTEQAIANLHRLGSIGVRLAVDDFGSADTRLATLRRWPVNCLKISRSLLPDVALIGGVVALAHHMNWQVLVKGIETAAERTMLQGKKGDVAQGYLVSRPLTATEFHSEFIQTHGRLLIPSA